MAPVAAIKFSQGVTVGVAGRAFQAAVGGGAVTCENGSDTDVARHAWTMLEVPPGSEVMLGPFGGDSPTATFTPDVGGRCYRVQLVVTSPTGVVRSDIRNVGVPDSFGVFLPPFQPLAGVDYSKDECNFGGQLRGWSGVVENAINALKSGPRITKFELSPYGAEKRGLAPCPAGAEATRVVVRVTTPSLRSSVDVGFVGGSGTELNDPGQDDLATFAAETAGVFSWEITGVSIAGQRLVVTTTGGPVVSVYVHWATPLGSAAP